MSFKDSVKHGMGTYLGMILMGLVINVLHEKIVGKKD